MVRQIVRCIFLEQKKLPTIDAVFDKMKLIQGRDVEHLNLFDEDENMPLPDSTIFPWSRSTLYRFKKRMGFIYGDRVTHYQYTKTRCDIIATRNDYLEWIHKYRDLGYRIYYQDETWVFKNMTCKKFWQDTKGESTQGLQNVPSGSGERSILSHVGSY